MEQEECEREVRKGKGMEGERRKAKRRGKRVRKGQAEKKKNGITTEGGWSGMEGEQWTEQDETYTGRNGYDGKEGTWNERV